MLTVEFLRSSCQCLFGLIPRATNRLRTATRWLSPVLMSLHRQEIGLRTVLYNARFIRHICVGLKTCSPPLVLWSRQLAGVSRPSLRLRSLLRNRSHTPYTRRARHTRPNRTRCHHRRLALTVVSQRVSFAFPRRLRPSCWKLLL